MAIVLSNIIFLVSQYTVFADSSILKDSVIYLYGNVRFFHKPDSGEEIKITSKYGEISDEKVLAKDSVHIKQGDNEIFCPVGKYFWNKEVILLNFIAINGNETLTGDSGKYFNDKVWVYKNMKYVNGDENFFVQGISGFYNIASHYGEINNGAKFFANKDSIRVLSRTLKIFNDTAIAINNVTVQLIDGTICFCDTLNYFSKEYLAILYGKPIVVTKEDSLIGKKVILHLKDRKVNLMEVEGNVIGVRK